MKRHNIGYRIEAGPNLKPPYRAIGSSALADGGIPRAPRWQRLAVGLALLAESYLNPTPTLSPQAQRDEDERMGIGGKMDIDTGVITEVTANGRRREVGRMFSDSTGSRITPLDQELLSPAAPQQTETPLSKIVTVVVPKVLEN